MSTKVLHGKYLISIRLRQNKIKTTQLRSQIDYIRQQGDHQQQDKIVLNFMIVVLYVP